MMAMKLHGSRRSIVIVVALAGLLAACNPKAISPPSADVCGGPLAISADGRYVVVSAPGAPITIRDSADGTDLAVLPPGTAQGVSSDAEVVTFQDAATGAALIWRRATGAATDLPLPPGFVSTWVGPDSVSADGSTVLYAARTRTGAELLHLYELATGSITWIPYSVNAHGKLSADGRYVAYMTGTLEVYRYDKVTGGSVQVGVVDNLGPEPVMAISGNGQVVAFNISQAGTEDQIYIRDIAAGTTAWAPVPQNGVEYDVVVDLDHDGSTITWNTGSAFGPLVQVDRLTGAATTIHSPAMSARASADGDRIAFCSRTTEGSTTTYRTYHWTRPDPADG
jgi:hypothetical protein